MSLLLILLAVSFSGASASQDRDFQKRQQVAVPAEYEAFSKTHIGKTYFNGDRSSFVKLVERYQHEKLIHGDEDMKSSSGGAIYTSGYFYYVAAQSNTCSSTDVPYLYGEGIALGVCQPFGFPSSFMYEKVQVGTTGVTVKAKFYTDFSCTMDKNSVSFSIPSCALDNTTNLVTLIGVTNTLKSLPTGVFLTDYRSEYECSSGSGYTYFSWQAGQMCLAQQSYYGYDTPAYPFSTDITSCSGTYVNSTTPAMILQSTDYNNTLTCSGTPTYNNITIPFCNSNFGYYTTFSCTGNSSSF